MKRHSGSIGGLIALDHILIRGLDPRGRAGGRHPGWGTANRILPLDGCYLEFVDVVDEEEAARSAFGRWVASAPHDRPFGWAVSTDEIDAVAERLGLEIADGARGDLRWKLAGVAEAAAEPCLPFFIQWAPGSQHPSGGQRRLERLDLSGDPARIAAWLGPHDLPITVKPGSPAVAGITLSEP